MLNHIKIFSLIWVGLVRADMMTDFVQFGLDDIFEKHKEAWISDENRELFENAVNIKKLEEDDDIVDRVKRDMPTMYMGKKKKMRTCANMNGILGGSNAFNYISFVMAVLTLVVNVNNNINNNNNNLNQANINTASNNNANANSNNNNANVVNVMPPGKKRRKRRVPHPFDIHEDKICLASQESSVTSEAGLASIVLVQGVLDSLAGSLSSTCRQATLCKAMKNADSLGLGGRILTMAVSAVLGVLGQEREMQRSLDMLGQCEKEEIDDEICNTEDEHNHIQCGRCGHHLADPEDIFNVDTPHALSVTRMELFGQNNTTVNELVNPGNFHFRSFNVKNSTCIAKDKEWQGGDTWYPGYSWRVCYCPVCGQAVGWEWSRNNKDPDWVGLRMGKVSDWSNNFLGPVADIPALFRQLVGK